jgi:hypothetical protein
MEIVTKEVKPIVPITHAIVRRNGLEIEKGLEKEQFQQGVIKPLREMVDVMQESALWWWGDAMAYAETQYGEKYSVAMEASGYSYTSLAHAKRVSELIKISNRLPNLSWTHHHTVAMMVDSVEDRKEWLASAQKEKWSISELKREIRRNKGIYNKTDPKNENAGQFAAIKAAQVLRDWFKEEDVNKWGKDQCLCWLRHLQYTGDAYIILKNRFGDVYQEEAA